MIIRKSNKITSQDKDKLLDFVKQTKNTIPLLTSEKLLENETREQIGLITGKINNLTDDFNRKDFPNESPEDEIKRMELAKEEGKTPVIALCEKNRPGFWVMVHSSDLEKIKK